MHGVTITELIEKFKLRNTTPDIDTDKIVLTHPDVNRPALQLTGFFDHFDGSGSKSSDMWSRHILIPWSGM